MTDTGEGERPRLANEWQPNWTIAPSDTLDDWFGESGLTASDAAARCDERAVAAKLAIRDVLERKPLTQYHADLLAEVTGISARLWLKRESDYRRDLAAGRKDVTDVPFPLPGEERRA
jgi:hypothetical protein